jgi:SAM-dependent methyltransferase
MFPATRTLPVATEMGYRTVCTFAALSSALSLGDALTVSRATPKVQVKQLFGQTAALDPVLADPASKQPLRSEARVLGGVRRAYRVAADGTKFPVNAVYADLTPNSGRAAPTLEEFRDEVADVLRTRVQTGLFRSPLTAFLYERGWRQNFKAAGFPGIEVEYDEVRAFFAPAADGVVVDMSCGSGLMTRRLLKSNDYGRVLALDFSEAMLTETARRVREEGLAADTLTLCRADVAALPLQPASIDAMHAGAALHCWPQLEEGLRQIRAALKPGGRFYATTFLQGAYGPGTSAAFQSGATGASFRFFTLDELENLFVDAGFDATTLSVRREGRGCAIIKAEVPVGPEPEPAVEVADDLADDETPSDVAE